MFDPTAREGGDELIAGTGSVPNAGGAARQRLFRFAFDALCSAGEAVMVLASGYALVAAAGGAGWDVPGAPLPFLFAAAIAYGLLARLLGARPVDRQRTSKPAEARHIEILAAVFLCFFLAAAAIGSQSIADTASWMIAWFAAAAILTQLFRLGAAEAWARLRLLTAPGSRAVIVGAGPAAVKLMRSQEIRGCYGDLDFDLVGFFDDRQTRAEELARRLPYLGPLDALIDFVSEHEGTHVFMALPWTAGARIASLLERLRFLPITVWLLPDPDLSVLSVANAVDLDGVRMPTLMTPPFSFWGRIAKRTFDLVAGSLILVLLSPVLIVTAILIKLDSPGPVLFRQMRSGQFGRKFSIFKFRSLHVAQADAEASTLVTAGDPRVSRVGRIIRKYSIDELPQIFNVLRGEMSLVGPRPHAPKAKADGRLYGEVVPDYALRYRVKPGMTGWAQVNGWRGETDTAEKLRKRVEFDFHYIRHWSFWLDLEILLRTVPAVILPKNNA
jgi:Undecaprenyl-phosphate glucose phosphotransferase